MLSSLIWSSLPQGESVGPPFGGSASGGKILVVVEDHPHMHEEKHRSQLLIAVQQLSRRSKFLVVFVVSTSQHDHAFRRLWERATRVPMVGNLPVNMVSVRLRQR